MLCEISEFFFAYFKTVICALIIRKDVWGEKNITFNSALLMWLSIDLFLSHTTLHFKHMCVTVCVG